MLLNLFYYNLIIIKFGSWLIQGERKKRERFKNEWKERKNMRNKKDLKYYLVVQQKEEKYKKKG